MDTASSSEAEPVTAAAPSERSSTVKEKATGTDRKKVLEKQASKNCEEETLKKKSNLINLNIQAHYI